MALDDGVRTAPAEITLVDESETNSWFKVVLHEGRNQQIRRMFDAIGHSVLKLRRVSIGHLKDEGLKVGMFRLLAPSEVARFKVKGRQARKKSVTSGAKKKAASQKR